ncbi:hypothetical protein T03_9607 [Trichinella britovi]|uniref:Uncharacterized protein n=1 Tax=Trichinella britovi TaxID=45882 RepID=A0A0V1ALQ2_TRIBR|nr:hypothetical protein T03_9607 [Trichinella britovi]
MVDLDQIRSDQMCIDNNMTNNNGEAKEKHNSYSIRVQFPQIQSQPVSKDIYVHSHPLRTVRKSN